MLLIGARVRVEPSHSWALSSIYHLDIGYWALPGAWHTLSPAFRLDLHSIQL